MKTVMEIPESAENCLPVAIAAYILDSKSNCSVRTLVEMIDGLYTCNAIMEKSPHVKIGEPLFASGFGETLDKPNPSLSQDLKSGIAYVLIVERHSIVLRNMPHGQMRMYDKASPNLHICPLETVLVVVTGSESCRVAAA